MFQNSFKISQNISNDTLCRFYENSKAYFVFIEMF